MAGEHWQAIESHEVKRPDALVKAEPDRRGRPGLGGGRPHRGAVALWRAIESREVKRLGALFKAEPDRLSRLSFEVAGLYFDWSKTHLDAGLVEAFAGFSAGMGVAASRDALFSGGIVNPSEGQAAGHVAERGRRPPHAGGPGQPRAPARGGGWPAAVALASARRQRRGALVDAIEAGAFGAVTAILHIGIGGSVLG